MFVLFAAFISSFSFAQQSQPHAFAGWSICFNKPKTFTILEAGNSFQTISFVDKTIKIKSASSKEDLTIPCTAIDVSSSKNKHWDVEKADPGPNLEEVMLDFFDKEQSSDEKVTDVITNTDEGFVHSKILVYNNKILSLHYDKWPQDVSLRVLCSQDANMPAKEVYVMDGKKVAFPYQTFDRPDQPAGPQAPKTEKDCPSENYLIDLQNKRMFKIAETKEIPAAKAKKASGKSSGVQ